MASNSPEAPRSSKSPIHQIVRGKSQATFKLNKDTLLLWRRALLIRYFKILGDDPNYDVKWKDFDIKSKSININDEQKPFQWKSPTDLLYKSAVEISFNNKKLLVVTLFYTTTNAMIQGKTIDTWLENEYKEIWLVIDNLVSQRTKGDNPNVDELFAKVTLYEPFKDEEQNNSSISMQSDEQDEETSYSKTVSENLEKDKKTSETMSDKEQINVQARDESKEKEISDIKQVLHSIERKLIENDSKTNEVLKVCNEMNEKFSEITKLKSDVEKLEKVVQNLNTNINSETMSTVARQLAWLGENIKMDLDRCENSQKIYQDSLVVLNRIEVTHKLLAQTANAVNMNRVVEELRVNQAETRETNKKIDKIDSDLRKNQMCKSHDTPVSHNDQSQDFRNDESEIDHNKLENSQEKGESVRSTQNSTNENTPKANLWIIGSSIVKDLNGRRIYRNKNTRINTLRDKTVFGATQFIKLEKVSAENVLFQIGSNDLERKQADCVLKEVEYLVATTRRILPATKIILAEILPRFLRDRDQSKEFEEKRRQYNTLLKDYCFDENIQLVEYSNMRTTDYIDGIHLNEVGVGIMVKCIKKITNPLLGIVTDTKQRSPDNQYRNQNYRNRPYQNTADNVGYKHSFYNRNTKDYNTQNRNMSYNKQNWQNDNNRQNQNINQNWQNQYQNVNRQQYSDSTDSLLPMIELMLQEMKNVRK
ncbi:unnamed protein product [Mytilus edulis]|uniref:SGNH hydrolase-type esterase domain-containing protein n=1 Tax=Mytilus edulis TaxID=6550 RepID=A0A8S3SRR9_MYTED|nr:unnamed protein product [Mytilus edulis]